jgi:hypothetical protein
MLRACVALERRRRRRRRRRRGRRRTAPIFPSSRLL